MDNSSDLAGPLQPGAVAPDFRLPKGPEGELSLSDLRGQPVVLVFYPADWSPVCGDQLALYNEVLAEFARYNAQLLAISVDGPWCHAAYSKNRKIEFPLLSDSEPKGKVAQAYGVYRGADGLTERALFLIDAEGIIRWSYVSMIDVNPGAEGILEELEKLPKAGEARGV